MRGVGGRERRGIAPAHERFTVPTQPTNDSPIQHLDGSTRLGQKVRADDAVRGA